MKKKILIVDDEESFADIVKLNLEFTGEYDVCVEKEGFRAVEAARREKPCLIVLDMILPDMDGAAIFEALHEDPELRRIPVVFLTAFVTSRDHKVLSERIGRKPHIESKPISSETLLAMVRKYAG
jgi:CheY-like chemotaxis protein